MKRDTKSIVLPRFRDDRRERITLNIIKDEKEMRNIHEAHKRRFLKRNNGNTKNC